MPSDPGQFTGSNLVIEARGGTWFRTPCPNCRAEPFKASAAAPRPRKRGRFRVAISDRPPSPPWDPRLPEIGTGARTSQYASNTVPPATTSILLLRPGYAERLREYNLGGGFCQFHWYRIIVPHCPPRLLAVESDTVRISDVRASRCGGVCG